MSVKNPSLGWERLQDVYYRNRELCKLSIPPGTEFKLKLTTTLLAVEADNFIEIFHYGGQSLARIDLNTAPTKIICYDFDYEDEGSLIMALSDRIRVYYNWYPMQFRDYLLPDHIEDTIWDYKNRVVVLSSSQDLYKFDGQQIVRICENNERFTLLTKNHWDCNGKLAVLLGFDRIFHLSVESQKLEADNVEEAWHSVVVSPQGLVCLYNAKSYGSRIYKKGSILPMDIMLESHPEKILWCANDTIACSFNGDEIKLYGPDSSSVTFWYPEGLLELETDSRGLRVVTADKVNFISRVGKETASVFLMGSTEPGSILLDSVTFLSTQTPRAVENLKIINLDQGVAECLEATLDELEPYWQKKLLSAAVFGKSSLPRESQNSSLFVDACDKVRVLNMLTEKGIILTAKHLELLGIDKLISRLIKSGNFHESVMICKFLKVRGKLPKIFSAWASAKILLSSDLDDESILESIVKLAESLPVKVSMASVATTAFNEGRPTLSKKLAKREPLPAVELSLLLELDECELALDEGLRLGIPEMTLSVLLTLKERLTVAQFTKIIMLIMREDQLFAYFCRNDVNYLIDFYRQADQLPDLAYALWLQGASRGTSSECVPLVKELYNRVANDSLLKNDQSILERQVSVVEFQKSLEQTHQLSVINSSLDDTLRQLITKHLDKQLASCVKKFRIPETKLYHLKCQVLSEQQRFDDLHKFALEKKSPIGYIPFFKSCLRQKRKKEAAIYVRMISGAQYDKKLDMYLQCESFYDAIQLAAKEKDIPNLKRVYKLVPPNEPQLKALITEHMDKFGSQR
ncbi:LADA_0D05754g1_1 [Lachancea dasiensis]|uniref:Probable vacuolar protein sorting-associated protein 16 homolog n=1 Tax=Lachancea dasiensis TaxID=1072105 RepID=A0A1G4J6C4_9SACH|nr:LADA_0D05754g1_1 [Lachancea dasiensis]